MSYMAYDNLLHAPTWSNGDNLGFGFSWFVF